MKKLTHIDCFSGPGGFCTGFKAAGFETLLAIELVDTCVETYSANHKEVPVIMKDIREVTEKEIIEIIGDKEVDLISSGMPCETFSTAGSSSRSFYDHRQHLYREAIRIADIVNAKLILFENVPGFQNKTVAKDSDRLVLQDLYDDLEKYGYVHHVQTVLNAADFGVPQSRERFFVLASREERNLKIPVPNTKTHVTVKDALNDLLVVKSDSEDDFIDYQENETSYSKLMKDTSFWKFENQDYELSDHTPPKHRANTIQRFKLIEQGEGLRDLFFKFPSEKVKQLQEEKILPKKWYIQRNRRLIEDKPSVTVTSHCLDELLHPTKNRSLTVREVARLQSFPDFYQFKGPMVCPYNDPRQDKYQQIGDAVPPLLAYNWGIVIKDILEGSNVLEEVK